MTKPNKLLLATALVAAVLTALIARAGAGELVVEAESFSLPGSAGTVFSDSAASGGQALLIWTNGSATKSVSAPAFTKIVVRARGDQCAGSPRMKLALGGSTVLSRDVTATSWTHYSVSLSRKAGTYQVAVSFTNDYRRSTCDRNLRVDNVRFITATTSTPAPTPTATPTPTPTATPTPTPPAPTASPTPTPATSETLYVDPNSPARQQADAWRSSRPADAAQMDKIAGQAQAFWFGEWSGDVRAAVDSVVTSAGGQVPVLVAYNIPDRDCGGYSAGGVSPDQYRSWVRSFASGIGSRRAIVVLEPDALASMTCLDEARQSTRLSLLSDAIGVLKAQPATSVYLDAGHSRWLSVSDAAARLNNAGVGQADGFSLNVSNFGWTSGEVSYGNQISALVGGKHFVIDTSRNGLGPDADNQWCNPPGRALGDKPTLSTGQALVDGYLWIKRPGESDGTCNGGPAAGQWWADYALGLAQRASW